MRQALLLGVGVLVVAVVVIAGTRQQEPAAAARFLRWAAFGLVVGIAGFFALFVVGEAFADPGGWRAVALVSAWVLPLAGCAALAWWRPDAAVWLLAALTALLLAWDAWLAVDPDTWRRIEDDNGPVHAVALLTVAAAVALLGLQRPRAAGVLLVLIGVGGLLALVAPAGGATVLTFLTVVPSISGVLYLLSARTASGAAPEPTHQSL